VDNSLVQLSRALRAQWVLDVNELLINGGLLMGLTRTVMSSIDCCMPQCSAKAFFFEVSVIVLTRHGDAEQYTFVPFAVESHGRLCKKTVDFLQLAAEWGAGAGLRRYFKGACLMPFKLTTR
jgi:hypothetical protein